MPRNSNYGEGKKINLKSIGNNEIIKIVNDNPHVGMLVYYDNRIIYANNKIMEISGYSSEEIRKMDIFDFLLDRDKKRVKEIVHFFKSNSNKEHAKLNIKKKDGSITTVRVAVSCLNIFQNPATLINVIDITKELMYEDFQKLVEYSNRFLTSEENGREYIRKLSHELNEIYKRKFGARIKVVAGEILAEDDIEIFYGEWKNLNFELFGKEVKESFYKDERYPMAL